MKQKNNKNKSIQCPFCFSKDTDTKESMVSDINNKKYTLHTCSNCGIHFFTPLKFENVYENEKDTSYIPFHKGRTELPSWSVKISKVLRKTSPNIKKKTILDVGAGDSINYKMLTESFGISSNNYYALELDKKSLASAKKRGVKNIIHQYFDKSILKIKQRFDVIIASEVLEHQVDPKEFMETCFEMLNKNGILIITVPNRKRMFFKFRSVPEDCPPHHFLRFDKAFFRNNFKGKIILVDHYGYGLRHFKDSCKVISKTALRTEALWLMFTPVVFAMRLFDSFKGTGIIAVMKK
jgi:2-polyprenyl-3-methyl-5-hydroxy-6-metoxy-1,4-benzoquinol methylase